ncbi:MAG: TRAP transporter small permease [Spirochaetes bacterium]|nr:TRAP transporter small permease [Spirochaetota bacterium]
MKRWIDRCIDAFLALLIIGMTMVVSISVFYRYVLNHPLSWSEEITRLMIVWLSFVGAYMAMRENKHIGFDLLVSKFSSKAKTWIALLGQLLILVFLFVVFWEGIAFSREFLNVGMPYTNLPIGWFYYSVFPVSGALMILQTFLSLRDLWKSIRST